MICNQVAFKQGVPYPRTCPECGLGPCRVNPAEEHVDNLTGIDAFKVELEQLLNKYSLDNEANTHDFLLAGMLVDVLRSYMYTHNRTRQLSAPEVEAGPVTP